MMNVHYIRNKCIIIRTFCMPRLRVVMDIDECMIHSMDYKDNHTEFGDVKVHTIVCEDGLKMTLVRRPYLNEFLDEINSFADVFAFTAALPVYARPVIKLIDPDSKIFKNVWFRDSCNKMYLASLKSNVYSKDLRKLGLAYDEKRTVLVDNNPFSFIVQPDNGVLVPSFYTDSSDKSLHDAQIFLSQIKNESDIRSIVGPTFNMKSYLANYVNENEIKNRKSFNDFF
jgi:Dullard-like phosphatase family protein